jgi:hypothetical protein
LANANTASGTQLVNGTSNVRVASSSNVTISSAGTANVLTISSTGTVVSGTESVTGNITGGNLLTGGLISATGSVTAASIVGGVITGSSVSVTGTQTAASTVGGVITGTTVSATGNISGSYFIGNGSQLTGLPASGLKWTTVANTAPASPNAGDFWYNSYTGIKYQYTNDGAGNIWVDQSFPTSFSTLVVTGNATVGNISATNYTGTTASVTGNITGSYILGNGSQLTGVTAASFAPVMFNDVSTQTNGKTAVFALLTDQTATTGISNSKQLQVTVNGAIVTPYINSWTWPFFTTYYGSYPGFRVVNLGYGLTANSVVIYNAPAVSSQVTITQINTSTDSQLRRYPYSATAIAIGD